MRVRSRYLVAVCVALLLGVTQVRAAAPLTVVELFTSQGCSSCPPADALLGELAQRDDILALSQHVDYWDYLGWSDPFASATATERQQAYARRFDLPYVYTPQMVVQGRWQVMGSDRRGLLKLLQTHKEAETVPIDIEVGSANVINIRIGEFAEPGPSAVLLVFFDHRHTTQIRRGENHGRTLAYHNVVRGIVRVGTWTGAEVAVPVDIATMAWPGEACAVIVQEAGTGRIYGAVRMPPVAMPKAISRQ